MLNRHFLGACAYLSRIVITGGAGFIGSHLVSHLLDLGLDVVAFDDLSNGSIENVKRFQSNSHFRFAKGTILKKDELRSVLTGAVGVVHLAAIVSVRKSIETPEIVHKVNVGGTLSVLQASVEANVNRIVLASSAAVYGDASSPPFREDGPLSPISLYGATKLAAESYCRAYDKSFGTSSIILRFANVYGSGRKLGPYGSVMVKFAEAISKNKPIVIFGDGKQTRDFVHVTDIVAGIASALTRTTIEDTFNLGSGKRTEIRQLAGLFSAVGSHGGSPIEYSEHRKGDIERSFLDISKARRKLGFRPKVSLSTGIAEFLKWYRGAAKAH